MFNDDDSYINNCYCVVKYSVIKSLSYNISI